MNLTEGDDHSVHALPNALRPPLCLLVMITGKTTLNVNALAPDVRHQFPSGFRIKVKESRISVVQVKTTVSRERDW